jgi:hypothetical protein
MSTTDRSTESTPPDDVLPVEVSCLSCPSDLKFIKQFTPFLP